MDFAVGLPPTQRQHISSLAIVDRMNKSAHFIRVKATYRAEDYSKLFFKEIVRMQGIPLSIISDRGTQ